MSKTIKQLKKLMNKMNMSQSQMAKIIGVTPVSMHRWMTGLRTPSIEHVEQMARALGMEIGLIYKE